MGCGKIACRHLESINQNDNFTLVSICDIEPSNMAKLNVPDSVSQYVDYKEMVQREDINFCCYSNPNSTLERLSIVWRMGVTYL